MIDWRKKIDEKFLYTKDEKLKDKPVSEIDDSKLLIKLGGIIELANLRGFESVEYDIVKAELDHVVMQCRIKWKETEIDGVKLPAQTYCSTAGASRGNSDTFWHNLLETCAENRAFVRTVRKYLGVNIVGEDEIKKEEKIDVTIAQPPNPLNNLKTLMENKGIDGLDGLKGILRKHVSKFDSNQVDAIKSWKKLEDIKPKECRLISSILQE